MSKTLTYEQMMALFAEGRKETAELRANMEKGFAEGRKETAELRKGIADGRKETIELRKSMAEGFAESRKETAELRESITRMEASLSSLRTSLEESNSRTEASIARLEAAVEKTNTRIDATNARVDATNAKLDENTAEMKKNNHRVGELTNKLGGIIENAVLPDIVDKFKEKGFKFNDVSVRVEILNESKTKNLAEIDAILENGEFVIAVEAKTDMKIKDVNAHIKRLDVLRKLSRFKGKKIYGALATAIAKKGPVNYALKHGFYVLQRPDIMGVKILDFPKGHSAKAW